MWFKQNIKISFFFKLPSKWNFTIIFVYIFGYVENTSIPLNTFPKKPSPISWRSVIAERCIIGTIGKLSEWTPVEVYWGFVVYLSSNIIFCRSGMAKAWKINIWIYLVRNLSWNISKNKKMKEIGSRTDFYLHFIWTNSIFKLLTFIFHLHRK